MTTPKKERYIRRQFVANEEGMDKRSSCASPRYRVTICLGYSSVWPAPVRYLCNMNRVSVLRAAALCLIACGREVNEVSVLGPPDSASDSSRSEGGSSPGPSVGSPEADLSDSPSEATGGGSGSGSDGDSGPEASGGSDSSDALGECFPGATICSGTSPPSISGAIPGTSAVQTCGVTGLWGTPWSCATGKCSPLPQTMLQAAGGACEGATTIGGSCQASGPGLDDCGASNESCCTSLEVPGGTYYRTYANDGTGPTGFADPATVSGFRLDKYLVTVGRFRQFVNAVSSPSGVSAWLPAPETGKHIHLNGGSGLSATAGGYEPGWSTADNGNIAPTDGNLGCDLWATWTTTAGAQDNLPINCVNWYEAYAFCIWDGGFLPSEAEWEYVAAGGSQQREFPWGATDPTGNLYAVDACDLPSPGCQAIAPVGTATLGAGYWGQLDLSGEVSEWALDSYAPYADPCADCVAVAQLSGTGATRVVRGGSVLAVQRPPSRATGDPTQRDFVIGFRCARTP